MGRGVYSSSEVRKTRLEEKSRGCCATGREVMTGRVRVSSLRGQSIRDSIVS